MLHSNYDSVLDGTVHFRLYTHFSNVTLALCWVMAPFLFYTILTQSKSLGTFKWLILNHSLWCLAAETAFAVTKPMLTLPSCSGWQGGFLRGVSDYRFSAVMTMATLLCAVNAILGLVWTLIVRYLGVFPNWVQTGVRSRWFTVGMILGHVPLPACIFTAIVPSLGRSREEMLREAEAYDHGLAQFFSYQSFFMMPHSTLFDITLDVSIAFLGFLLVTAVITVTVFLATFHRHSKVTHSEQHAAIRNSSLGQFAVSSGLLIIPLTMCCIFIRFDVVDSALPMLFFMSFQTLHCPVEYCTTLYFVAPYRHFVTKCFKRIRNRRVFPLKQHVSFITVQIEP